jgi:cyanophycinase
MRFLTLLTVSLLTFIVCSAQTGKMLLVGGGSEKNGANGWNVPAYRWAVEGKRVAIIGTSTGSLAPYLKQYCGASFAKEFAVATRDSADSQVLFDTLQTYQVIFFRGGDQYDYYQKYKNTRLQQAAEQLYESGGTLAGTSAGMHILSSVVFTAENGTVYPYEAIENPHNSYMTLEDDFMDFFPGYLFDTHFSERARFGRLAGFLAKYSFDHQANIIGLGMDDMTCMTVDETKKGTVYGTGCANIYTFSTPFQLNGNKLLHESLKVTQLIQGCTYDFSDGTFTMPSHDLLLETSTLEETGNYTILASGGNTLSFNQPMMTDFVTTTGNATDPVVIATGNETTAGSFKNYLLQQGAATVDIIVLNASNGSSASIAEKIQSAVKILFVGNTTTSVNEFLLTENGILLKHKLRSAGMISAFAGDDARFAGKTVVDNFYTEYASYYGELVFSKGFSLLKHSMLMPNTFYQSSMYENSATAIPFAMATDTLKYGIWLTSKNYLKITPVEGKTTLLGYGTDPVMILRNEGGKAGLCTQTGSGSSSSVPRMEAGFENLSFALVDYTLPYVMGNTETSSLAENELQHKIRIFNNPVSDFLHLESPFDRFKWSIISADGRILSEGVSNNKLLQLTLNTYLPGVYVFKIRDLKTDSHAITTFIKY